MATQVQFRRGTTTQNNAFTGAIGEITYDTEIETLRLHDGSTPGGGAIVATTTASQTLLNKVLSTGSSWEGGIIDLAYGGTGAALTAAAGGIVYSTSDAMGISSVGASGQVLTSGGTNAPTWVNASALTVGTSTTATSAENIEGGSSGYLVYQISEDNTGFITPGQSGFVLRSTGASTAPNWVTSAITIGTTELQVGDTGDTFSGLDELNSIGTSHWTIPAGTTAQRPSTPADGQIRYNSTISSFEGYGPGNAWGSLGGVKDVDQDTYITTETSAGSDEDTFTFYNAGSSSLTLSSNSFTIASGIDTTLNGALIVQGDLTVNGTTTTLNSTTLEIDDKNIVLASGAANAAAADGAGITIDGANATILYDASEDKFSYSKGVKYNGEIEYDNPVTYTSPFQYYATEVNADTTLTGVSGYEIRSGSSIINVAAGQTLTISAGTSVTIG